MPTMGTTVLFVLHPERRRHCPCRDVAALLSPATCSKQLTPTVAHVLVPTELYGVQTSLCAKHASRLELILIIPIKHLHVCRLPLLASTAPTQSSRIRKQNVSEEQR